jgi:hypothetical protein
VRRRVCERPTAPRIRRRRSLLGEDRHWSRASDSSKDRRRHSCLVTARFQPSRRSKVPENSTRGRVQDFPTSKFHRPRLPAAFRANCRSDGHNFLSQAESKRANQGPTLSANAAGAPFCTDACTGNPVMPGSNSFQGGALLEAIAMNTVTPFRARDRTKAERQRRYRAKRREAAVTFRGRNGVTVDAPPERNGVTIATRGNVVARRQPHGWPGKGPGFPHYTGGDTEEWEVTYKRGRDLLRL